MDEAESDPGTPQGGRSAGLAALGESLIVNGLVPYLVFRVTAPHFPVGSTVPLLLSAVVPAASLLIGLTRRRTIEVIAVVALVQLTVSVVITVLSHSATDALVGHALQPAALGLVFGVSAILGRPLIEPLARQSMAGNDPERQARFDARARLPAVRRVFAWMTTVWAVTLCAESALLLAAAERLPTPDYLWVASLVHYGVLVLLIGGSIRYGRWRAAALRAS